MLGGRIGPCMARVITQLGWADTIDCSFSIEFIFFLTSVSAFLRTVSSDAARHLGASIHEFLGKLSTGAQRALAFAVIDEAPQSHYKVYSHLFTCSPGMCE